MNELEKAILDIIEKRYDCKYVGGIKVVQLPTGGYKLTLNLGYHHTKQLEISADLKAEDFLKFIEQEIVDRQLIQVQWFTGIKNEEGITYCEN